MAESADCILMRKKCDSLEMLSEKLPFIHLKAILQMNEWGKP
jgi:hypothetical protein